MVSHHEIRTCQGQNLGYANMKKTKKQNECCPYSEHNFEGSESYQECTKCDASRARTVSSISQKSNTIKPSQDKI